MHEAKPPPLRLHSSRKASTSFVARQQPLFLQLLSLYMCPWLLQTDRVPSPELQLHFQAAVVFASAIMAPVTNIESFMVMLFESLTECICTSMNFEPYFLINYPLVGNAAITRCGHGGCPPLYLLLALHQGMLKTASGQSHHKPGTSLVRKPNSEGTRTFKISHGLELAAGGLMNLPWEYVMTKQRLIGTEILTESETVELLPSTIIKYKPMKLLFTFKWCCISRISMTGNPCIRQSRHQICCTGPGSNQSPK